MCLMYLYRHDQDVLVAHFDHKMRKNATQDAIFVAKTAKDLGLPFVKGEAKTKLKSEASAREARYAFLRTLARKYHGEIYVAQHADDLIESAIINLLRGTGWRGLAPMSAPDIKRPLLSWQKKDCYAYAGEHQICFRQDESNFDESFLRNRLRRILFSPANTASQLKSKAELLQLILAQRELKKVIDQTIGEILKKQTFCYQRKSYQLEPTVSLEILRALLLDGGIKQTRPQVARARKAILAYPNGAYFSLDKNHFLKMGKSSFKLVKLNPSSK